MAVLTAVVHLTGCTAAHLLPPPQRLVFADDTPVAKPSSRGRPLIEEVIEMSFVTQLEQAFDLPRVIRKIVGRPYEAIDVDNFDEVPDNSWFTNRNTRVPMSLEKIRRGPCRGDGPDPNGSWTVVSLKTVGVTPGMVIDDSSGERYIIKFDPPDFAELSSGAEMVTSRLFHAAGYNVPENYIAHLDPEGLTIGPGAIRTEETADNRDPLTIRNLVKDELAQVLRCAASACRTPPIGGAARELHRHPSAKGQQRIRVLASRFLAGVPVGPWSYIGTRGSDPNDVYPHEHRREVRGLYVVSSWLNHADMKEENTLDMYDPRLRTVRHCLIDFGASLGSNSTTPSDPRRGQANSFDVVDPFFRLVSLGLYVHDYERAPRTIAHPAVGYIDNSLFEPDDWKPMYPVPAFENLTARDAFWGARIVVSFSDAQIGAAVSAAEFSSPEAALLMKGFLIERRDRIGRFWFSRLNPLDRFQVSEGSLGFTDLAVRRGYSRAQDARYEYRVTAPSGSPLAEGVTVDTHLLLNPAWRRFDYVVVSLLPRRLRDHARPVSVYARPESADGEWVVVGLRRPD
jgi:hypothetical protein